MQAMPHEVAGGSQCHDGPHEGQSHGHCGRKGSLLWQVHSSKNSPSQSSAEEPHGNHPEEPHSKHPEEPRSNSPTNASKHGIQSRRHQPQEHIHHRIQDDQVQVRGGGQSAEGEEGGTQSGTTLLPVSPVSVRLLPLGSRGDTGDAKAGGDGEGISEGGTTQAGDGAPNSGAHVGERALAQGGQCSADGGVQATDGALAQQPGVDDSRSRRGEDSGADEQSGIAGGGQQTSTSIKEEHGEHPTSSRSTGPGHGERCWFLEPVLSDEEVEAHREAPWACMVENEAQWRMWQSMQIRDEEAYAYERRVSQQFWFSTGGGQWVSQEGILPNYVPGY